MMKKYYVDWSVEGILSNWGILFGRCFGGGGGGGGVGLVAIGWGGTSQEHDFAVLGPVCGMASSLNRAAIWQDQ